jgi:NAD(P)-dependent dehydrogenase (short-subunit alcohol dehydrogenase family)
VRDFTGLVVVVTGAGGLLGRGMAGAFAGVGAHVIAADLDFAAAEACADLARARGVEALAVRTDVTSCDSVDELASTAFAWRGAVHVLCNNAGRTILKPFRDQTAQDWDAVLGVQFHGVLNSILSFMPRLIPQTDDSHIVNVASMSGVGLASMREINAPYVTAKHAVVGLSEVMAPSLALDGIGVSVLCPGWTVADPTGEVPFRTPSARHYQHNVLGTEDVAQEVLHGIRESRLHIFPHRAGRREVEARHQLLMHGFDQAERTSPPETAS